MADPAIIRTTGYFGPLATCDVTDELILEHNGLIVAVAPAQLDVAGQLRFSIDPAGVGGTRVLFEGIEADDAWSLDPQTGWLICVRETTVSAIPVIKPIERKTWTISGLPEGTYGVAADKSLSMIVGQTSRQVDPDFERFEVYAAELRRGEVIAAGAVLSPCMLRIAWWQATESFLIYDADAECLWSWRPGKGTAEVLHESPKGGHRTLDFGLDLQGRFVCQCLAPLHGAPFRVLRGVPGSQGVKWTEYASIPGGDYGSFAWRPASETVAFCSYGNAGARLCLLQQGGKRGFETDLPDECVGNGLLWSADGARLYSAGDQALCFWSGLGAEAGNRATEGV